MPKELWDMVVTVRWVRNEDIKLGVADPRGPCFVAIYRDIVDPRKPYGL